MKAMIKHIEVFKENSFSDKNMKQFLLHDSSDFKIINFSPGQELPIHSHDIDGQLSIVVLEGSGEFLGNDNTRFPANPGDVLIADIREPHGIRAKTHMRVLVTIAPPI